jgi:plastocyanin
MNTFRSRIALVPLLAIVAPLGLAACGDDDATTSPTTTSSAEEGVGADKATYGSECSPVGEDLQGEAIETVEIQLADYAFVPADGDAASGVVTFAATNVGQEAHELAFLPGGGEVPFTEDGAPDEEALAEADAFELEAFPAGDDCTATYDLEPGEYTLFCIVEAPDGETHYEKGMAGTLTVS